MGEINFIFQFTDTKLKLEMQEAVAFCNLQSQVMNLSFNKFLTNAILNLTTLSDGPSVMKQLGPSLRKLIE